MRRSVMLVAGAAVCAQSFLVPTLQVLPCKSSVRRPYPTDHLRMSTSAELPTQAKRQQALYDMVYVERLPDEQQMTSGLFLPTQENPRMHVCKVLSIGGGREGESGYVSPNDAIKSGDLVYVKDPYGIGPRDDEFSGRKFSFVRYSSICAILPNSETYEEAARSAGALQAELSKVTGGCKF